jgi:protein ImuA
MEQTRTKRDQQPAPAVSSALSSDRRRILERLRRELARLEGQGPGVAPGVLPLGLEAIDAHLPDGGLARGCLHEITGPPAGDIAAAGFAAALLGRLAGAGSGLGTVVWIGARSELYGPGLLELGLDPGRLIVVRARDRRGRLWALEEVLRSPGPVAGLAEVERLDLTESRRLQLAAERRGVSAFLLRPESALRQASAAFTRWRVQALPGGPAAPARTIGPARWQVELVRARTGRPGRWAVEWRHDGWCEVGWLADPVAVAAEPGDRPAETPRRARLVS